MRKVTVNVPAELLEKAQEASGAGIAQTVRTGLQLVAASRAYARLRQFPGKVRFSRKFAELKSGGSEHVICISRESVEKADFSPRPKANEARNGVVS